MNSHGPSRETGGSRRPVAFALVLLALLAVAIEFLGDDDRSPKSVQPQVVDAAHDAGADPPELVVGPTAAAPPEARKAVDSSTPDPTPVVAVDEALALRGRVVDPEGAPVPGAQVELRRGVLVAHNVLDLNLSRMREVIATTTSDADGEFRFLLARGVEVDVYASSEEHEPASAPNRRAGQYVVIKLSGGFRITGRVTRAHDGTAVSDALVRAFQRGGSSGSERRTTTDADGRYALTVPDNSDIRLAVVPIMERASSWIPVDFDQEGRAIVNVEVEDGFTVMGRITSAADGLPVIGATIGEGWTYRRSTTSDQNGEYRLTGMGAPGVHGLYVKAHGFGGSQRESVPEPVDGVSRVDFELLPGRRTHGRVVDENDTPLEGVLVAAIASDDGPEGQMIDWLAARTDANGVFEIDSLTPELRHALMLAKRGYGTRVYDFPETEFEDPDLDLGVFTLGPPGVIAGVVQDQEGTPIEGASVYVKGTNSDRDALLEARSSRRETIGDFYSDSRSQKSDADGCFSFGDLAPGSYEVYGRSDDHSGEPRVRVRISEGEVEDDIVLEFDAGAGFAGRVVDSNGQPVEGAWISPWPTEHDDPSVPLTASIMAEISDADGRFAFRGLPAGTYAIDVDPPAHADDAPLLQWKMAGIHTSDGDVEVALELGALITGNLRNANGSVPERHLVVAKDGTGQQFIYMARDDGWFRLVVEAGSVQDLAVYEGNSTGGTPVLTETGIVAGTRDLVLTLP